MCAGTTSGAIGPLGAYGPPGSGDAVLPTADQAVVDALCHDAQRLHIGEITYAAYVQTVHRLLGWLSHLPKSYRLKTGVEVCQVLSPGVYGEFTEEP